MNWFSLIIKAYRRKKASRELAKIYNQLNISDLAPDEYFKWTRLIPQEVQMWIIIGDKKLPKKEVDLICERRGFNEQHRDGLIRIMKAIGMYGS